MGFRFDPMLAVLVIGLCAILISFYHAHKSTQNTFNLLDLLMENGKLSKIGVAFMLTLGVTTWLMIDLQIKEKMTEGYLTIYVGAWVGPLVARVIFGKTEVTSNPGAPT